MEYLVELGTEELPAGTTLLIAEQFESLFFAKLFQLGISLLAEQQKLLTTPRRICLILKGLPTKTAASEEEVKGPGEQAPEQAIENFLKNHNLKKEDLVLKNNRYHAIKKIEPIEIEKVLSLSVNHACDNLTGDKWMTWAEGDFNFSRPVRWISSLIGNGQNCKVLDLEKFGLKANNKTRVNRLLEEQSQGFRFVEITSIDKYEQILAENLVLASAEERKQSIREQIAVLEKKHKIKAKVSEDLLTEVADLLEWPSALVAEFDQRFLSLPTFLTTTVLEKHQRYFPCYEDNNKLSNKFIFIANCLPEAVENVIKGNQKVLTARLNDAEFFVQEDLKKPLSKNSEKLEQMTFQKELEKLKINSSMKAKAERIQKICLALAKLFKLSDEDTKNLSQAAEIAKCDLASSMVFEFAELQGYAGAFIAEKQKENSTVSTAIQEQYSSLTSIDQSDSISSLGALLSIADQIDNITSIFFIGKIPTGSADPFALRRQANWVCYLLTEFNWQKSFGLSKTPSLEEVFEIAYKALIGDNNFGKFFYESEAKKMSLAKFIHQRLLFVLPNDGTNELKSSEEFKQSLIPGPQSLSISTSELKTNLAGFAKTYKDKAQELKASILSIRRISRILKDQKPQILDSKTQFEGAEIEVFNFLSELQNTKNSNWSILFKLNKPINYFFENVLVNDPNDSVSSKRRKELLFTLLSELNKKFLAPDWEALATSAETQEA